MKWNYLAPALNLVACVSGVVLAVVSRNWLALAWVIYAACWVGLYASAANRANALAHEMRIMRHILRGVDDVHDANRG